MKFTVERESFLEAVSRLSRVVSTKTAYPVLEGILHVMVLSIAYNFPL
jgi:DNA polymerase III sliding clamp (beta) subunit (PCNA family)